MSFTLPNFDGAHGKHVGDPLPAITSDDVADEYCISNGYPGWVRRNGPNGGVVYILAKDSLLQILLDFARGKYKNKDNSKYNTRIVNPPMN